MRPGSIVAYVAASLLSLAVFGPACSEAGEPELGMEKAIVPFETAVVRQIELPKGHHEGIYHDGRNVWVSNGDGGDTWVIDPATNRVAETIKSPAGFTEAVTLGPDGRYYLTDWFEKKLYAARIESGKFIGEAVVDFAPSFPAGVIWNGANFFAITWTRGLAGTRFHLIVMDEFLQTVEKVAIKNFQEPSQMAWDGKSLWISSWYDRKVYRVDVVKRAITGYFVSPVPKTTGVAFDGEFFWLTGTSGDLYQMKVGQ